MRRSLKEDQGRDAVLRSFSGSGSVSGVLKLTDLAKGPDPSPYNINCVPTFANKKFFCTKIGFTPHL
jgi:hypothetical protein